MEAAPIIPPEPPSGQVSPVSEESETHRDLHSPGAEFTIRKIGSFPVVGGAYADVWEAVMTRNGVKQKVALKVFRFTDSPTRLHQREEREKTWCLLWHEHIAPLLAIYRQPNGYPVFVSQWYENGTAKEYLKAHPSVNPIKIIYEIACGLQYLHDKGIIHGDLKGSNVLIDENGHARIIDFGLSRLVDAQPGLTTSTLFTLRWCPRELLISHQARPTRQTDVYEFASTILELMSGEVPYNLLREPAVPLQIIFGVTPRSHTSGFIYDVPRSATLWDLIEDCWAEPSARPTISEVRMRLSALRE